MSKQFDAPRPPANQTFRTLRLVLGDQLNPQHSWFQHIEPDTLYVLMELQAEQQYCRHHLHKISLFLGAMRLFAQQLLEQGHQVHYWRLTDQDNQQDFGPNLDVLIQRHGVERVAYQLPDEYRLDRKLADWAQQQPLPVQVADTEHFLTTRTELAEQFRGKKQWLMERFYRRMRVQHKLLMDGEEPEGGQWNFDAENRKTPPKGYQPPAPYQPDNLALLDTVLADIRQAEAPHFGEPHGLPAPLNRHQALEALAHFVEHHLADFGRYQDALVTNQPWLHHSLLSFPLNVKLLHPLEVIQAAVDAWRREPQRYPLSAVEGFVRQLLGWREYMRGIYWALMPEYAQRNTLEAQQALPAWYWTGQTNMHCMQQAVGASLRYGYAHHIQRLMITGNFAALAGVDPEEVNAWYLGVYVDAVQWVQLPNTTGMSQWADGGVIATKPYVSSGSYINRMSDYCKGCSYNAKTRHGERACPFNSLYWHFLERHRQRFARNPRMAQMYATWDRMDADERSATLQQAEDYLNRLDEL